MSYPADCTACLMGNHGGHDRDWNITPGLIGGNSCDCTGDCAERFAQAREDLATLLGRAKPGPWMAKP